MYTHMDQRGIYGVRSTTKMIYRETKTKTGKLKLRYKMEAHTIGQNREIITIIYKDT